MKSHTHILKDWRAAQNRYGDPETRSETEIWEWMLQWFQQAQNRKYLKHFHSYEFTPDVPEHIANVGTMGEAPFGTYLEKLVIYYEDSEAPQRFVAVRQDIYEDG